MNRKSITIVAATLTAFVSTAVVAAPRPAPVALSTWRAHQRAEFEQVKGTYPTLYDQTQTGGSVQGVLSQNFASPYESYSSAAADDFVVPDPSGWTITQVNVDAAYFVGSAAGPVDSFDVNIFPDDMGIPGAAAACAYTTLAYTNTGSTFFVPLVTACSLPTGTYWVSVVANMDFAAGGGFGWNTGPLSPGNSAMWQNPQGALLTGCTTWTIISTCKVGETGLFFQILGQIGSDVIFQDDFERSPI